MSKFTYYRVGGCVRDYVMGVPSKDIDLLAIGGSFEELEQDVVNNGGQIYISKPEYLTVRCNYPKVGPCDIRLARKDGDYSDGRRPDKVFLAEDVKDDVNTRDFKMNALLQDLETGEVIDYVGGLKDIQNKKVSCVGDARDRFEEDYLRLCRAVRFGITKGFSLDREIINCLEDFDIIKGLKKVSQERIREELLRCFMFSSFKTIYCLNQLPLFRDFILTEFDIWLKPTLESR